jgi:hypothetical protein
MDREYAFLNLSTTNLSTKPEKLADYVSCVLIIQFNFSNLLNSVKESAVPPPLTPLPHQHDLLIKS